MRSLIVLTLLGLMVFSGATPLFAQLGDLERRVQVEAIQTAPSHAAEACPGSSPGADCADGSRASGFGSGLLSGLAASCGSSGGGLFGGIIDLFKRLFGGIVDFFRGIFDQFGGGGTAMPPVDGGGTCPPPTDPGGNVPTPETPIVPPTTPVAPPVTPGGDTPTAPPVTPVTPPVTPGSDTAANPPATPPPMDLSDLEKKAGLIEYNPTKNFNGSPSRMLNDIESHIATKHGTMYRDSSQITWAHETSHGICSDIRNGVARREGGYRVNGFYLGNNKAYIMKEFNLRKRDAARYIPASLRSSRYGMYITGQTAWDDTPSYIFDEWVAYTNGSITGMELVRAGRMNGNQDGVKGTLEFTFYSLGLAMAVEKQDPGRFDEKFKAFMALQMKRAMAVYFEGAASANFRGFGQDELLQKFLTASDTAAMRDFVKRVWGESFFREVFRVR